MPEPSRLLDAFVRQAGFLFLLLVLVGMCLLPVMMVGGIEATLRTKLHLSPEAAALTLLGILLGSLINIPLYRVQRDEPQTPPRDLIASGMSWVPLAHSQQQTIVAVNVGGCVIPALLAIYQISFILGAAPQARFALLLAMAVNIFACARLARPIPGVGIALPGFLAPLLAVGSAWLLLAPDQYDAIRAPVAFVAGVSGPLIGADLMNLRQFERISVGVLSIGGAGTFDGIVLSGLLAALLA